MTDAAIPRYLNLFRHIRNWPAYWSQKSSSGFKPARFVTRGTPLVFEVPTRELYLVFKEIFLTDFYSIRNWIRDLPPNPMVIDVGANAGYFDMLLLSKRPDARIFAYEPVLKNFELFTQNVALNSSIRNNVQIFNKAVTGKPVGELVLFKEADSENSVTASVFRDFETHNLNSITVRAVSLEQILDDHQLARVDFLKLDCEGSEYPIMYESPASVWRKISSIFLEVHNLDNDRRNFESLKKFLESVGYRTTSAVARNGCYALFARRHA